MTVFNNDQIAVVTGAALGIGRAAVDHLLSEGMRVVAVDLPGADFDAALAGFTGPVHPVRADLSDPDAPDRIAHECVGHWGVPHLLMNNAVSRAGRGFDAPQSEWGQAMEVNLWAPINLTHELLPAMEAAGGHRRIVNVGSKQGITNPPGHPVYNMTKAALKSYTEGLEHALGQTDGPRVTAHLLIPGWTTTGHAEPKPGAWTPQQVVAFMEQKLAEGAFYILCPDGETTPEMDHKRILWGVGDVTEGRPPLSRWHPRWKDKAAEACS